MPSASVKCTHQLPYTENISHKNRGDGGTSFCCQTNTRIGKSVFEKKTVEMKILYTRGV